MGWCPEDGYESSYSGHGPMAGAHTNAFGNLGWYSSMAMLTETTRMTGPSVEVLSIFGAYAPKRHYHPTATLFSPR